MRSRQAQAHRPCWVAAVKHACCKAVSSAAGRLWDLKYSSVHRLAEAHFLHIREAVAQESAPATLKAAFLEPVSRSLATDLSVHLFARADQHFMAWFTCAPRHHTAYSAKYTLWTALMQSCRSGACKEHSIVSHSSDM